MKLLAYPLLMLLTGFAVFLVATLFSVQPEVSASVRQIDLLQRYYAAEADYLSRGADEDDLGALKAQFQVEWNAIVEAQ